MELFTTSCYFGSTHISYRFWSGCIMWVVPKNFFLLMNGRG